MAKEKVIFELIWLSVAGGGDLQLRPAWIVRYRWFPYGNGGGGSYVFIHFW